MKADYVLCIYVTISDSFCCARLPRNRSQTAWHFNYHGTVISHGRLMVISRSKFGWGTVRLGLGLG